MRRFLAGVSWCLVITYPLAVFFGLRHFSLQNLATVLVVVALVRLVMLRSEITRHGLSLLVPVLMLLTAAHAVLADDPKWLRLYPVAINASMLLLFAASLWHGPSFVERMARLTEPDLAPRAVLYTRQVTRVWCIFFAANGLAALYTALYSSFDTWAIYNGVVAYVLMAVLFLLEWLIRRRVQRSIHENA